jgi:hypothetical protein
MRGELACVIHEPCNVIALCATNLCCTRPFTAALVARQYFELNVQNAFAIFEAATLAVNGGESSLDQGVTEGASNEEGREWRARLQ